MRHVTAVVRNYKSGSVLAHCPPLFPSSTSECQRLVTWIADRRQVLTKYGGVGGGREQLTTLCRRISYPSLPSCPMTRLCEALLRPGLVWHDVAFRVALSMASLASCLLVKLF